VARTQLGRFQGVEKMIPTASHWRISSRRDPKKLIKPNDHIKILAMPKRESINAGVAV
jgi:hypothetical protein